MPPLDLVLRQRLALLDQAHLRRSLSELQPPAGPPSRVLDLHGRTQIHFASNDYLGLARHPEVRLAAADAARTWGAGATASRLICGSLGIHHHLERALATFKGRESALLFSSGYQAATGTIPALVGPNDVILLDRLAHSCLVEGARRSQARIRVFRHNDTHHLEQLLAQLQPHPPQPNAQLNPHPQPHPQILIVTESVFSMDGDVAPLRELAALRDRYQAWLMVDEAHATGVLGPRGKGAIEAAQTGPSVDILLGTLGKSLGASGGYIAGSRVLCDFLVNQARSFIFSTAPAPPTIGAALAALAIVDSPEGDQRREHLARLRLHLHQGLEALGWPHAPPETAIVPLHVGPEPEALRLAAALREQGILIPAIRYPTVKRGQARLRITLGAFHTHDDLDQLLAALRSCLSSTGIRPAAPP